MPKNYLMAKKTFSDEMLKVSSYHRGCWPRQAATPAMRFARACWAPEMGVGFWSEENMATEQIVAS